MAIRAFTYGANTDAHIRKNITIGQHIKGPSTFTIDPGGDGQNTGTLVVQGDLQVQGTQTNINSSTLTVDDLNITVADGAGSAAAANGAGLTVAGANATLTWTSSNDSWNFNKKLTVNGVVSATSGTSTEWNTAYGWGDHSGAGYLTSETFTSLVQDTTPQLGGTLDTNSNDIDFNGASKLILDADADTTISSITSTNAVQDDAIIFKMENFDAMSVGHGASGTGQAGHTIFRLTANRSDQYASPSLQLFKNSSSPAVNDYGGSIEFMDNDSGGNQTTYATIVENHQNVTDGSEEGSLYYWLNKNGTSTLMEGILYNAHYFANKQTLKWYQHTSTYDLDLATPATITASRTITLPDANGHIPVFTTAPTSAITDGSPGQVLQTDGAGALSFVTVSATETDTLDSVTGRGATTSNSISVNQLTATIATGTAPLVVSSTTKVNNLNADKVDDKDYDDFVAEATALSIALG